MYGLCYRRYSDVVVLQCIIMLYITVETLLLQQYMESLITLKWINEI